jgi:hypothetical protein
MIVLGGDDVNCDHQRFEQVAYADDIGVVGKLTIPGIWRAAALGAAKK